MIMGFFALGFGLVKAATVLTAVAVVVVIVVTVVVVVVCHMYWIEKSNLIPGAFRFSLKRITIFYSISRFLLDYIFIFNYSC